MSNVMIVDDALVMREAVAKLLTRQGHTVCTAENGKHAWTMLYSGLPDLIILDLMMPEMGGIMFLRMLRRHHHWHDVPVLVLTGLDHDESMVQDAKGFGVVDIIRKGSDSIDRLMQHVNALKPVKMKA
jgi:adenylate cyclase